jgi:hypothetical protein
MKEKRPALAESKEKIRRDEARAQRKVEMEERTHAAAAVVAAVAMGRLGLCGG